MTKLTPEYLRELFNLDEEKGELYWKTKRQSIQPGDLAGCLDKGNNRWVIEVNGKRHYRARLIFLMVYEDLPREVDHKDLNPLNDRPTNLRACSGNENDWNRPQKKNNRYGFKGIQYFPRNTIHPFVAYITVNGKSIWLGSFSTPEEAYLMRCFAALYFHAEFACP